MVRRIGYNDKSDAERQDIPAAAPEGRDIAERPPGVQRNWTRIVFQALWVDLWAIAAFKAAEGIFESLIDDSETLPIDYLVFLSVALLGGLISVRKLFRLLRGQPVVAGGFLKQTR
jgi:hypothetical protein